jgi:hypothetical protein
LEDDMSLMKAGGALLLALVLPLQAMAAPGAVHFRHHHHHHRLIGPGVGVSPETDIYGPAGGYAPTYGGYGGELYSPSSGGVNAMSNDFGTSGVLGHTNGMPATRP